MQAGVAAAGSGMVEGGQRADTSDRVYTFGYSGISPSIFRFTPLVVLYGGGPEFVWRFRAFV